ncbi:MAG: hypothetical protein M3Y52_08260 [Actinomycetota bacterium]|nr:hypothetical protein [Actinomycetota bacterium]
MGRATSKLKPAVLTAIAGVMLVAAYASLGALQILVLNPLAAAPGLTLARIHAELTAANESLTTVPVIIFVALGLLLAGSVAVFAFTAPRASPTVIIVFFLVVLAFGTPAYFAASFSAGMALADTFAISGGDHSRWSIVLYATSAISFAGALGLLVVHAVRIRRTPWPSSADSDAW